MINSKRIAFIIPIFTPGGAERVLSLIANYWAKETKVLIITIYEYPVFYNLDSEIEYYSLSIKKVRNPFKVVGNFVNKIKGLKKKLEDFEPDYILSFLPEANILSICVSKILKKKIIINERNNPKYDIDDTTFRHLAFLWKKIRNFFYKQADLLIVQTDYAKGYYMKHGVNSIVIPNPIKEINTISTDKENIILGVGRLAPQKQFHKLIESFSQINSDWKLIIVGEGTERKRLEELIEKLHLTSKVSLVGLHKNIDLFLSKASIFVLSSKYEGFPNVLCEAMSAGIACISFDCIAGPSEIIEHDVNGLLIKNGDTKELTSHIKQLVNDAEKRKLFGQEAMKIREVLSMSRIIKKWEDAINSC